MRRLDAPPAVENGSAQDDRGVLVRSAAGSQLQLELKKEGAVRPPYRWEQFRPAGLHGEDDAIGRRQDDKAHGDGLPGVRRHALTIVFRAR